MFGYELVPLLKPTNPEQFWLLVTALATVALAVIAGVGLTSLLLAKKDMLTRATREARATAIARADEWGTNILPAHGEILKKVARANVPIFVKDVSDVHFDPDKSEDLERAKAWWKTVAPDLTSEIIFALNRVEAWAMFFTQGLADQKIAALPCAPTYCQFVVQYYPILLVIRSDTNSGKFPNTVQLFKAWLAGLKEEQRQQIRSNLQKQMEQLDKAGNAAAELLPKILGT